MWLCFSCEIRFPFSSKCLANFGGRFIANSLCSTVCFQKRQSLKVDRATFSTVKAFVKVSCFLWVYRSDVEGAWQVYQRECQPQDRFPSDSCCVHMLRELGSTQDIAKLNERMF